MNSERRFLPLRSSSWLRAGVGVAALAGLAALIIPLQAALGDYDIAQEPLYSKQSQPPLMMMVMSRDEQLFNKAYSDYSDLDGTGCWTPPTRTSSITQATRLQPLLLVQQRCLQGQCRGEGRQQAQLQRRVVGNFLNWVTMSRLDVMRYVLYGGQRFTDTKERRCWSGRRSPAICMRGSRSTVDRIFASSPTLLEAGQPSASAVRPVLQPGRR